MAGISPDVVRSRIASALTALAGWAEAPVLPMSFPGTASRPHAHKTFAVLLDGNSFPKDEKQRGYATVEQRVRVLWSHRIRAAAQVADYGAALAAEAELAAGLSGVTGTEGPTVRLVATRRTSIADHTYILGEITATAHHRYPL